MIITYTVPEIWDVIDVITILHFGVFFALLLPQKLKKLNFYKNEKAARDIILHWFTKNYD